MNKKEKDVPVVETTNSQGDEIIIEEDIVEEDDIEDDAFLKSLEEIDKNDLSEEEEQRLKNKNAEEARKRREAEAKEKVKLEEERLKKEEQEKQAKLEQEAKNKKIEEENKEVHKTPQEQVKDLTQKYPELDLGALDSDKNFKEYLEGKWLKGGKTITEIYENFVEFQSRLTKQEKEVVSKQYTKPSTPIIKGTGGTGGSQGSDIYSMEELEALRKRMPTMNPKEYDRIEKKYEESLKYHKNKKW